MNICSFFVMALITTHIFCSGSTEIINDWWNERLHCHIYFPQNNYFFHWNTNVTLYFQYFFTGFILSQTTCSLFTAQIYQPKIKPKDGASYFYKYKKCRQLEIEKKISFSYFISEIPNFSNKRFCRKCSMVRRSISLKCLQYSQEYTCDVVSFWKSYFKVLY